MFNGLASTGTYFNQVLSLSSTPISSFTISNWSSLVSLLSGLLHNPFFYCIIGIIVIMTLLPTVNEE